MFEATDAVYLKYKMVKEMWPVDNVGKYYKTSKSFNVWSLYQLISAFGL